MQLFTDSTQMFFVVTRGKRPTEKRFAVDITAAHQGYLDFEIDRFGLVPREDIPANAVI